METIKTLFVIFLFNINCFGQSNRTHDTIKINFDKQKYINIAFDSLKKRYNFQKELYEKELINTNKNESISLKYKFEDLHFYSIPIFKIKKKGPSFCYKNNIECIIDFEGKSIMQNVVVLDVENNILTAIDIPDLNFVLQNDNPMKLEFKLDKLDTEKIIYNSLLSFPKSYKKLNDILKTEETTFIFKIFGIENVIFEVSKNNNKLYASYVGNLGGLIFSNKVIKKETKRQHMLANEYILKYIGSEKIKNLAKGEAENIFYEEIEDGFKKYSHIKNKEIFLKVITIE
ncbi:hypothetical protein OIU80_01205 [Flavobacterium sp. LS1R47]|uniref:Uncharacterized protein n=1 Tax=Flavobacterium frigoritolerans TaxID=2987686 RepID=A0A9X2YXS1_9FLAO|nr:hypothetical protein [Flavobacterium frigoritolerans]MCV9930888.1 hypothetical protein [Flavobacterium frigoritolerans]